MTGQAVASPPTVSSGVVPNYPPATGPLYGPGISPGPTTMFQGAVQPPPTSWDPYATPGTQTTPIFPQDPYFPPAPGTATEGGTPMTKFLQDVHIENYWIPGNAPNELGLVDSEIAGTFAVPFLYNEQTPLLITPGFGHQSWNGPKSTPENGFADLPANTFDAFLEFGWNPQPLPQLGADLAVKVGVWSDFTRVTEDSIRVLGRGLMVLTFSPSIQLKGGIIYLDRVRFKLWPAGGLVWTPNSDVRLEILFPDPRLARRITTVGNTDWWLYLRGEYGGGSWTVNRVPADVAPGEPLFQQVDYNDIRVALGLEWIGLRGWGGFFEVGGAFDRELVYNHSSTPIFRPDPMVFLGGGVSF